MTDASGFGVAESEVLGPGVADPVEGTADSVPGEVDEAVVDAELEPACPWGTWPSPPQEVSARATAGITIRAEIRFMTPMLVPPNSLLACQEAQNRGYFPLPARSGTD